jgi:hypothetical protein
MLWASEWVPCVSEFMNLGVCYFSLVSLCFQYHAFTVWLFAVNQWDYMAGSHSTPLLLLCRSLSALPSWVFIKWGWLLSCFIDWDSINHLICFVLPKSVVVLLKITFVAFLLFQVILCCHLCVICSWNQISILYWQRIAVFVTVLSLPVTDGHWNCTVCLMFAELWSEFDVQPEQSCKLHIVQYEQNVLRYLGCGELLLVIIWGHCFTWQLSLPHHIVLLKPTQLFTHGWNSSRN